MTNEQIEALIDLINVPSDLRARDRIFLTPISERVAFAKVWTEEPKGGAVNEGSHRFFFVRDEENVCVAAIFDMASDLHVFVKREYRKRGHLCRALDGVILPKLFQEGRKVQELSFNDASVADYFVRRLGFKMTGPLRAEKDLSIYDGVPLLEIGKRPLTKQEVNFMHSDIMRAKLYLTMVKERLQMAYGDTSELMLDDLIRYDVGHLDDQVYDFMDSKHRALDFPPVFGM